MKQEQYRKLPAAQMSGLREIEDMAEEFASICTGEESDRHRFYVMMEQTLSPSEAWNNVEMLSYLYWFYIDKFNSGIGTTEENVTWGVFLKVAESRIRYLGGSLG